MYHLVKSIYLHATSLPEYSILLLGLDAAGKTTLLNQIKSTYNATNSSSSSGSTASPGKTVPTVGQNTATVSVNDQCYLRIWDVGGQHSLRNLWQSYYASCHAIVFVVDSTDVGDADISKLRSGPGGTDELSGRDAPDRGRLGECRRVLEDVLNHSDAVGVPLLILANKQDREDSESVVAIKDGFVRRIVEGEKGSSVRDSRVLPCSALSGTGVQEAVDWLKSRVEWNKEARPPVMR